MADDCRHGQQHYHHHHHHAGLAEGLAPRYAHKLQMVMCLAIFYFAAQIAGSYFSGSLALLADAGHKLADIGAIGLALMAAWFASLSSSPRKTFGYYRLEILAALLNGMALFGMAFYILYEAYQRLIGQGHIEIEGQMMLGVALLGLLVNLVAAWLLYPVRDLNLNVKGALFHVMADVINSLGTMLAAAIVLFWKVMWVDTLASVLISALVLHNAWKIFSEAFGILMEAAPRKLDVEKIRSFILARPGVTDLHDLHVWTITTGKEALLAHVRVTEEAFRHETSRELEKQLRETFDLCHITVQLEPPGFEEEAPTF